MPARQPTTADAGDDISPHGPPGRRFPPHLAGADTPHSQPLRRRRASPLHSRAATRRADNFAYFAFSRCAADAVALTISDAGRFVTIFALRRRPLHHYSAAHA